MFLTDFAFKGKLIMVCPKLVDRFGIAGTPWIFLIGIRSRNFTEYD
jgi:hypothetical protein